MAKILVLGGAGYVGSGVSAWLMDQGHEVHVLDDLSTGHAELVLTPHFIQGDMGDAALLDTVFSKVQFDGVMHFAAKSIVSESVKQPELYFLNNIEKTETLLKSMEKNKVRALVFSSTCAVYGDPKGQLMNEALSLNPMNPYGESKLAAERKIQDAVSRSKIGLSAVALRYFNAAGADPRARVGEWHEPETHLIPSVFQAVLSGRPVSVFGEHYPTPDGTCIRDYVHIWDLAAAHEEALMQMLTGKRKGYDVFNLGSESGYSVLEVIETTQSVLGIPIKREGKSERPGDPPRLVADASLARKELGFKTRFALPEMIETAWSWEQRKPHVKKTSHLS